MELRALPAVDTVQVYLLFYRPTRDDPWLNRLVALVDGPFSHVEIALPDRYGEEPWERVVWGSSIYQGEPVFLKQKTYKREGYVSIAIEVTFAQLQRLRSFCRAHAEQQTPFSSLAMYAAYLPVQLVHTEHTFCSKYVTQALQAAGVPAVARINAALTTPSVLYRRLNRKSILQVVPSKMMMTPAPPPPPPSAAAPPPALWAAMMLHPQPLAVPAPHAATVVQWRG